MHKLNLYDSSFFNLNKNKIKKIKKNKTTMNKFNNFS